jgi:cytidine deaminase
MNVLRKVITLFSLAILVVSFANTSVFASQLSLEEQSSEMTRKYTGEEVPLNAEEVITNSQLDTLNKDLLLRAAEASQKAYCPFSGYHVGCALRTEKDNFYTGCNVENDAFVVAICSERNALTTAVAQEGPTLKPTNLAAIVIDPKGNIETLGSPCGACRQFMTQFKLEAKVVYFYKDKFRIKTVEELMPHPFYTSKVNSLTKNAVEAIKESNLDPSDQELLFKALEASKKAYCPITNCYSGCALETEKRTIFTGCDVENDSYGVSRCSESNTLTTAVGQEGPSMQLMRLATITIDGEENIRMGGSPCGSCRQAMAQSGIGAEIIYFYNGQFHKRTVEELIPDPFYIPRAKLN